MTRERIASLDEATKILDAGLSTISSVDFSIPENAEMAKALIEDALMVCKNIVRLYQIREFENEVMNTITSIGPEESIRILRRVINEYRNPS